jgi:anti-sigma-K factor RskA
MTAQQPMTHEEALELAGLYALDVLTPDEKAQVDAHLAACALDHSEIESLGGVAPALASLAPPLGAPAALKRKVLIDYATANPEHVETFKFKVVDDEPGPRRGPRSTAPNWMGWAAAGIAVVLLAVLGVVGLNLKNQADLANQRADQLAAAVAALTTPGSEVAVLHGSGAAANISGFAAFPAQGGGYMVMTGVPGLPAGQTYQAWYIADGAKISAGTMATDENGSIVATNLEPAPNTDVVAVTIEPTGGSDQPTSDPVIVGSVTTVTAPS